MLKARNYRAAKGNKEKIEFLDAGYGLSPLILADPPDTYVRRSWLQMISIAVWVLAFLVLILFVLAFLAAVHILTLIEIYRQPNFPHVATLAVIWFVFWPIY